jgi:hypothetical protein
MKDIKLNMGLTALVDDKDYTYLNQFKWYVHGNYASRYNGCANGIQKNRILMHREILHCPPDMQVDHIDHNCLNNQKSNLRICNNSQNHMNINNRRGRSGFRGVIYFKKYIIAQIRINGIKTHLGVFKTEIDAAKAYDNAAKLYHKNFANLNFK